MRGFWRSCRRVALLEYEGGAWRPSRALGREGFERGGVEIDRSALYGIDGTGNFFIPMIPQAFNAVVHHLAPSMANNLLQYRPSNLGLIIKLDILPIKYDLDPRNPGRVPMPSPR